MSLLHGFFVSGTQLLLRTCRNGRNLGNRLHVYHYRRILYKQMIMAVVMKRMKKREEMRGKRVE